MTASTPATHSQMLRELMAFYAEAGVDVALQETPMNRLAEPDRDPPAAIIAQNHSAQPAGNQPGGNIAGGKPPLRHTSPGSPATPRIAMPPREAASVAPDTAALNAREAARGAASLDALRVLMEAFDGCALKATATQLVFADGNPQARIMLVGEAPGAEEDKQGLPFVGRSGQLLNRMLAAIGLDRNQVYIANVIPWRPPGNRTPTPQETQICLPFIKRQIELVNPDILVCLGNPSSQALLETREGITRTHGRWFDYNTGTRTIRALPTFHPAYLLRSPIYKRHAWADLRAIKAALGS